MSVGDPVKLMMYKAGLKLHKSDRKLLSERPLMRPRQSGFSHDGLSVVGRIGCRVGIVAGKPTVYLPVHTTIFGDRLPMRSPKTNMPNCHCQESGKDFLPIVLRNLKTSQRQDLETQYCPCINVSFMHFFSGEYESGKRIRGKGLANLRKNYRATGHTG